MLLTDVNLDEIRALRMKHSTGDIREFQFKSAVLLIEQVLTQRIVSNTECGKKLYKKTGDNDVFTLKKEVFFYEILGKERFYRSEKA